MFPGIAHQEPIMIILSSAETEAQSCLLDRSTTWRNFKQNRGRVALASFPVLSYVSLRTNRKQIFAIIGASGSGRYVRKQRAEYVNCVLNKTHPHNYRFTKGLLCVNAPLGWNAWDKWLSHLMKTCWQRDKNDSGIRRGKQMGVSFLFCWWSFPYVPVLIILGFWPYFRVEGFDEIFVWAGE